MVRQTDFEYFVSEKKDKEKILNGSIKDREDDEGK